MIEDQLADRFRAAIADEPPLGFDPDGLANRAAHDRRRQSAVIGTSVAAATVVLATVTVLQVVRAGDVPAGGVGSAPTTETQPCPTKREDPDPTGTPTKPTGPTTKPTEPPESKRATETKPDHPKPTPLKPLVPCDDDVTEVGPFAGWEQAVARIEDAAPKALADHLPGVQLVDVGWKALDERRCLTGAYQLDGDGYKVIALTVCHDQNDGLDLTPIPGDWGPHTSDSVRPDGSHLRVYRFGDADTGAVALAHHRVDGVIVHAGSAFKAVHGQNGPDVSEELLAAIVTDPRLAF